MEFKAGNYVLRDKTVCQNCGQQMSEQMHTALMNALAGVSQLPERTTVDLDKGFTVALEAPETGWAPDPED